MTGPHDDLIAEARESLQPIIDAAQGGKGWWNAGTLEENTFLYRHEAEFVAVAPKLVRKLAAALSESDAEVARLRAELAGYGERGALAYEREERMLQLRLRTEALKERNQARAERDELQARIDAVLDLHRESHNEFYRRDRWPTGHCNECGELYPCAVRAALSTPTK